MIINNQIKKFLIDSGIVNSIYGYKAKTDSYFSTICINNVLYLGEIHFDGADWANCIKYDSETKRKYIDEEAVNNFISYSFNGKNLLNNKYLCFNGIFDYESETASTFLLSHNDNKNKTIFTFNNNNVSFSFPCNINKKEKSFDFVENFVKISDDESIYSNAQDIFDEYSPLFQLGNLYRNKKIKDFDIVETSNVVFAHRLAKNKFLKSFNANTVVYKTAFNDYEYNLDNYKYNCNCILSKKNDTLFSSISEYVNEKKFNKVEFSMPESFYNWKENKTIDAENKQKITSHIQQLSKDFAREAMGPQKSL